MPQVNLSTLNGPELRQMLDSSRRRGEAKLTYQILQEMAARRDAPPERSGVMRMLRPGEPRFIDIDLGDPMDPKDELPPMPAWRAPAPEPQAAAPPQPEPPPEAAAEPAPRKPRRGKALPAPTLADAMAAGVADLDAEPAPPPEPQPRSVWDADPEPGPDLQYPNPPQRLRGPSGLRRGLAAGFAAGAAAGVALGWWFGGHHDAPPPAAAPAAAIQIAALAPSTMPPTPLPAEAAPASQAPPALSVELAAPEVSEAPLEIEAVAAEKTEPVRPPETPRIAVTHATGLEGEACAAEPTPADRQICGDEALRRLQLELRQAYAEALDAHEDRALLRQRQLAWRTARDTVSDPIRLAQLYEQRIRKLHAATAEARQQQ